MDLGRLQSYDKEHCWQYDIRVSNLEEDLVNANISKEEFENLKVSDFSFERIESKIDKDQAIAFIKRHEWLGTISQYTTHWFVCKYKDNLAGVMLFNVPNAFSKLLGEDTKELERLISRGACISWSPKNLGSKFLTWCVDYMVKNTQYRMFSAYSDPTAKELGTIYQACNFYYMGKKSGTTKRYISPHTGKMVSDRYFRQKTAYKRFAKELGIEWQSDWNHSTGMLWENVPDEVEVKLRSHSKYVQSISESISFPHKHKYVMVKGRSKKETKKLRKLFEERNKIFPYPKDR
ncbi:conserved hypothetical protein [Vibrio phage 501E54-1]|nr:conserved hypothetical protein [Vibrio phage 501E54-1]